MKEYLKMEYVFNLPLNADMYRVDFSVISDDKDAIIGGFGIDGMSELAAHAINSHDELVENMQHYRAESERWEMQAVKEASRAAYLELVNQELLAKLSAASEKMKAAHESMFEQCLSNPVFNAWGKELNLSAVNELQVGARMADEAIEMAEGSSV